MGLGYMRCSIGYRAPGRVILTPVESVPEEAEGDDGRWWGSMLLRSLLFLILTRHVLRGYSGPRGVCGSP